MELNTKLKTTELVLTYGNMLTKKQLSAVKCYYLYDMGLTEIAELEHISRQGAYDLVTKATQVLNDLEEVLGVLKLKDSAKMVLKEIEGFSHSKEQQQKIDQLKLLLE